MGHVHLSSVSFQVLDRIINCSYFTANRPSARLSQTPCAGHTNTCRRPFTFGCMHLATHHTPAMLIRQVEQSYCALLGACASRPPNRRADNGIIGRAALLSDN